MNCIFFFGLELKWLRFLRSDVPTFSQTNLRVKFPDKIMAVRFLLYLMRSILLLLNSSWFTYSWPNYWYFSSTEIAHALNRRSFSLRVSQRLLSSQRNVSSLHAVHLDLLHMLFTMLKSIESAAYPAPGNTAFQGPDSGANEVERDLIEGQETAIIFLTEPESAAYPAPGNTASPVPDSGVNDMNTPAEWTDACCSAALQRRTPLGTRCKRALP